MRKKAVLNNEVLIAYRGRQIITILYDSCYNVGASRESVCHQGFLPESTEKKSEQK
jgi:hypothetical protein